MKNFVVTLLRYRPLVLLGLVAWLTAGVYGFRRLDVEAYPDPSPPMVEVITQNPEWSPEEIEQQITVPIETMLNGMPRLEDIRSASIFGLSDIKVYFDFDSDYFRDRQEVLGRLQLVTLPPSVNSQISPWSAIGEIYRFQITGKDASLNDLKATVDWQVRRELKRVPGIIDITSFGGTTKQYQAEIDPRRLLQFGLTLPQVVAAVASSNANAGASYITLGTQSINVRGLGLLRSVSDMDAIVIAQHNGAPVFLRDVADVHEGFQPRLGRVGLNNQNDIVKATVLLQRDEQSLPALEALHQKVAALNGGLLPRGMRILPIYDRTDLIGLTTATVRHLVLLGLVLVTLLLLAFLGDLRMAFIAALSIPASLLFAFGMMVLTDRSANLISIGAIDFGILVDAVIIGLERIYVRLQRRAPGESPHELIAESIAESSRPVIFSVLVILVAFIPLFTMRGVPGRIFAPMSITYGFALVGAQLFALCFAPVLASIGSERPRRQRAETPLVAVLYRGYARALPWVLGRRRLVLITAGVLLTATFGLAPLVGGEFMPKLEEGNLWIRATLPQDISFEASSKLADEIRATLRRFPETTLVVSQVGRPDDGTDPSTFNNIEISCDLKPQAEWPRGLSKEELIRRMDEELSRFPGIDFNFSQNIQDNVEEAMSGVKGENSLKLFGDDIATLARTAIRIRDVMAQVRGVDDLGVFRVTGQPNLVISIDRAAAARYGLMAADLNTAVGAAVGGITATQILEGDRRFDFVVRYKPAFRQDPQAIRDILLPTPDGGRVPLGQVAKVGLSDGAFTIYRENGQRFIPIKFSVRGRDLASTVSDVQDRLAREVRLPEGYHYEWAGEYDSLRKEQRRLAFIIPVSLAIIAALLYLAFGSLADAIIVLAALPFGTMGGLLALLVTGTPFSISAAVGFASVFGVGTLAGLVFLSGVRLAERRIGSRAEAIEHGSLAGLRPVVMACLAAGLGLVPAAISHGIGVQAQQPLARVVVGGMLTTAIAIPLLMPVLASLGRAPAGTTSAIGTDKADV